MKNKKEIREIAAYNDTYNILSLLQEECAELIKAISKYRRGVDVRVLYAEAADVEIMLDQFKAYLELKHLPKSCFTCPLSYMDGDNGGIDTCLPLQRAFLYWQSGRLPDCPLKLEDEK